LFFPSVPNAFFALDRPQVGSPACSPQLFPSRAYVCLFRPIHGLRGRFYDICSSAIPTRGRCRSHTSRLCARTLCYLRAQFFDPRCLALTLVADFFFLRLARFFYCLSFFFVCPGIFLNLRRFSARFSRGFWGKLWPFLLIRYLLPVSVYITGLRRYGGVSPVYASWLPSFALVHSRGALRVGPANNCRQSLRAASLCSRSLSISVG